MNRRVLAAVALVSLLALTGCATFFGDEAGNPSDLSANATYDFDTDRDGYIVVNGDNYTAVYDVSARTNETIDLYTTDSLSVEQPLAIRGLQYRYANDTRFPDGTLLRYVGANATDANATNATRVYPNGTTESVGALRVSTTRKRTTVTLPDEPGRLAFTAPKDGKELAIRPPVNGSFELLFPPDTDARLPLLSQVRPSNDDRRLVDDRVHLTWQELDTSVLIVRWYLDRDLWLFGGLALVGIAVGLLGAGYYYLQVRRARQRREAEGIDVDYDDDDRREPPPGMG
jgi:hypothetical protein